jgi:hypothetical protein
VLNALSSAVERELTSIERELWGEGLGGLIEDFLKNHARLMGSLKGSSQKDNTIKAVSIAAENVDRREVANLVQEGQVALETLVSESVVDSDFQEYVDNQREILLASDLAEIGTDRSRLRFFARIVINAVGFYKKASDIAASTLTVADSSTVLSAIKILKNVAKKILSHFEGM